MSECERKSGGFPLGGGNEPGMGGAGSAVTMGVLRGDTGGRSAGSAKSALCMLSGECGG